MKWRTFGGIIKLETSGLELGRRSKCLKRHFAATPVHALNRRYDISRAAAGCSQEHDRNESLLLSAGSFALLFGFLLFGSLCPCSFCFSLLLFCFLCNSRFVILSSSFLSSSLSCCCFCFLFITFLYVPSDLSFFCFQFFFIHVYSFFLSLVPLPCSLLPFFFPFLFLLFHLLKLYNGGFLHVLERPEGYEVPKFVIFSTLLTFPLPYIQFHPAAPLPNTPNGSNYFGETKFYTRT